MVRLRLERARVRVRMRVPMGLNRVSMGKFGIEGGGFRMGRPMMLAGVNVRAW